MLVAKVNLSLVHRVLAGMRNPDLRPAFKAARKPLRVDIRDHARRSQGPDGAFAPLAASTVARRASGRKGRGRGRRLLGRMPTANLAFFDRRSVKLRSRFPFSEILRTGGRVGHGSQIPGRDWMWASDRALYAIARIVRQALDVIFERGG